MMRHLSRFIFDDIEYAVTTQSGGYFLHRTDVKAQFAGTCMDIDPQAIDSVIAGLTEARRIWVAEEQMLAGVVGAARDVGRDSI